MIKTKIFAHRGASVKFAENTMPAFEEAIRAGADGIELDIQKTKDNQIIVTHDENLKRVTLQNKKIVETDYSEIKQLNAAAFRQLPTNTVANTTNQSTHSEAATYIPLLSEVLDLLKPTNLLLNIELKNAEVIYPELEEDTLSMIRQFNMEERIVFSSFNHYSIVKLRKLKTTAELAFLYMEGLYKPWKYAKKAKVFGLHPYYPNLIIPDYMDHARKNNVRVRPWTVDDTAMMQKLIYLGVDGLITNDPAKALHVKTEMETKAQQNQQANS